jgi:hypothetical protein
MKMTDQVVALISHEHAKDLIWDRFDAKEDLDWDDDTEYEVKKTVEQEENVTVRPGFRVGTLISSQIKT